MEQHLADRIQAMIRKHAPTDEAAREAFVYSAWLGSPLIDLVDYNGTRHAFSTHLYMRGTLHGPLANGEHALAALLAHIASLAGAEDRDEINHLLLGLAQLEHPAPATRQHDVFLSYARADRAAMEVVRAGLRAQGMTVWTDDDLAVGTPNWVSAIDANLRAAGAIVVLCSPSSDQSKWVREEWLMGQRLGLGVFPVLLDGDGFPLGLQSHQGIDGRKADLATVARQQLAPALATFLATDTASSVRRRSEVEIAHQSGTYRAQPAARPPKAERDRTNPTHPDIKRPRRRSNAANRGCVFVLVFLLVLVGSISLAIGLTGGEFSPDALGIDVPPFLRDLLPGTTTTPQNPAGDVGAWPPHLWAQHAISTWVCTPLVMLL